MDFSKRRDPGGDFPRAMTGIPTELDLQALLAEEHFVRRLARGLLFDEHRVDDVVQQTWLQALRTPPKEKAALRSWLSRVVRGFASNEQRDSARRRRREAAAAVPEELPSVDDVLEREALRQQVLQALVGLPEPYRTTVLLRYFEDLQPAAIAARTGLPGATVRTRLKRGLDLLRQRLDREHGGDRRAWCTALLPLARAGDGAGMAIGTAAGWLGVLLAMKKLAVGIGITLGLVLGAFLAVQALQAPEIEPEPESTSQTSAALQSGVPDEEPVVSARRARSTPAVAPSSGAPDYGAALSGFRGRLVLPDGSPAGGQRVRIVGVDGVSMYSEGSDLWNGNGQGLHITAEEADSDDDGRFEVFGVWPRAMYVLQAGIHGANTVFLPLARTPGPGETIDLGDIVLPEGAVLVGRVLDPDGEPAADVEVWAADIPGVILSAVPMDRIDPGAGAMLLLPDPSPDELAGNGDYFQRLRWYLGSDLFREPLDPEDGEATLRVFDAPQWVERVWDYLPLARARTGPDGSFRLVGVQPGGNMIVAHRRNAVSAIKPRVLARAGETRDVGTLRLDAGDPLRGRVVDSRARPVSGAQVRVAALGLLGFFGMAFAEPQVEADAEGRFTVRGLPRGRVLVAARRSPSHAWTAIGPLHVDDVTTITLPPSAELSVAVRGRNGEPVEGAQLRLLEGPMLGELTRAGLQRILPLEDRLTEKGPGDFFLDDLSSGVYTLHVQASGYAPEATMVRLPDDDGVEVTLSRAESFDVLVTGEANQPVSGAKVYVQRASTPDWARSVMPTSYGLPEWQSLPHMAGYTDAQGRLQVTRLPAGSAYVSALHPAFGQAGMVVQLPVATARLILPRPAVLRGTLTDGGAPADPKEWRLVMVRRGEDLPTGMPWPLGQAVPETDGTYRAEGLMPGLYSVQVQPSLQEIRSMGTFVGFLRRQIFGLSFFDTKRSREVVLAAGEERRLDFDLQPGFDSEGVTGSVTGIVTVDGTPVAGMQIYDAGGWRQKVLGSVDSEGAFRLDGLPEGELELQVRDPSGEDVFWSGKVVVGPGQTVHLDLRLSTGALAGTVRHRDGSPGAELNLAISGDLAGPTGGTCHRNVVTDAAGRFRVDQLPGGTYAVEVRAADLGGSVSDLEVVPGAVQQAQLTLHPMAVLEVTVSETARSAGITHILVSNVEGTFAYYSQIGEGGSIRFGPLSPGGYTLRLGDKESRYFHAIPDEVDLPWSGPPLVLEQGAPVEGR